MENKNLQPKHVFEQISTTQTPHKHTHTHISKCIVCSISKIYQTWLIWEKTKWWLSAQKFDMNCKWMKKANIVNVIDPILPNPIQLNRWNGSWNYGLLIKLRICYMWWLQWSYLYVWFHVACAGAPQNINFHFHFKHCVWFNRFFPTHVWNAIFAGV